MAKDVSPSLNDLQAGRTELYHQWLDHEFTRWLFSFCESKRDEYKELSLADRDNHRFYTRYLSYKDMSDGTIFYYAHQLWLKALRGAERAEKVTTDLKAKTVAGANSGEQLAREQGELSGLTPGRPRRRKKHR